MNLFQDHKSLIKLLIAYESSNFKYNQILSLFLMDIISEELAKDLINFVNNFKSTYKNTI